MKEMTTKKSEIISIDFEFYCNKEEIPTLVCCALRSNSNTDPLKVHDIWLYKTKENQELLKKYLIKKTKEDAIFLCYGAGAEASCFRALGLSTEYLNFIDLWAEWRILRGRGTNPRFFKIFHGTSPEGLVNACAGLTGVKLDYEHKDKMRDIIISGKNLNINRNDILLYCIEDIQHLFPMWKKLVAYYEKTTHMYPELYTKYALNRGTYTVLLDTISSKGVLMDMDALKKIDSTRNKRIRFMQDICNGFSPKMFQPKRKADRNDPDVVLKFEKKIFDDFLKEKEKQGYPLRYNKPTDAQLDKGEPPSISADLKSLKYYEEVLGIKTPIIKARKIYVQETKYLDYFNRTKGKPSWDDYIGEDNRLRPYFSPFGSITMRNYPPATCFPPVRPNAIRKYVLNDPGSILLGIDYKSQEFAIAGIMSQDMNMLKAYDSGDVYIALAKQVDAWDGEKKTRFLFKVLVLSIIYGRGINSIMWELRTELGLSPDKMDIDTARVYYDYFWNTYSTLKEWQSQVLSHYNLAGHLYLTDGTMLWSGNKSELSIKNWPIQAMGGAILRKAQILIPSAIQQVWPVHDAIYTMVKANREDIETTIIQVKRAMTTAWYDLLNKSGRIYVAPRFDVTLFGKPELTMPKEDVDYLKKRYTILPCYQKS